jgi:hypothetical protein
MAAATIRQIASTASAESPVLALLDDVLATGEAKEVAKRAVEQNPALAKRPSVKAALQR